MDPIKEAEQIASDIQGTPTGIRFVSMPKTRTGFTLYANIVGANIALQLSRKWQARAVAVHYRRVKHPLEVLQGMRELEQAGVITTATRGRVWLDICMPDPAHRRMFEHWDGDNQNRSSADWEQHWLNEVAVKNIRTV